MFLRDELVCDDLVNSLSCSSAIIKPLGVGSIHDIAIDGLSSDSLWCSSGGTLTFCEDALEKISFLIDPILNANFKPDALDYRIKKVIFNDPATVVIWKDGTKTVVKCCDGDTYDKEKGFMACIIKKLTGNTGRWNELIKKYVNDKEDEE